MSIQPIHQLFAIDKQGGIYIATTDGLLWIDAFDPNHTRLVTSKEGLPRGPIDALYFGSDGVLWFAVGHRLGRLRAPTSRPEILPTGIGRANEAIAGLDGSNSTGGASKNDVARKQGHVGRNETDELITVENELAGM